MLLMIPFAHLQVRQNDRLAVNKLVTSLTKGTVRSPLAQCLLIRYTSQVLSQCCGICCWSTVFKLFMQA